jgi:hypothetical protein
MRRDALLGLLERDALAETGALRIASEGPEPLRLIAVEMLATQIPGSDGALLEKMALADPSPEVRATALNVLAGGTVEDASAILQRALTDRDSEVRSLAKELLEVSADR